MKQGTSRVEPRVESKYIGFGVKLIHSNSNSNSRSCPLHRLVMPNKHDRRLIGRTMLFHCRLHRRHPRHPRGRCRRKPHDDADDLKKSHFFFCDTLFVCTHTQNTQFEFIVCTPWPMSLFLACNGLVPHSIATRNSQLTHIRAQPPAGRVVVVCHAE